LSKAKTAIAWDVYRPKKWGQPTKSRALPEPWYGLDTERDAKSGKLVCAWIVNNNGERKVADLFDCPTGTYWVYNLAYDIEGMLRDLQIDNAWAAKADGARFELEGGTAVYYHGKRFDYRKKGESWRFLEAAAFNGRRPLSTLGAKEEVDASAMSLWKYQRDADYRQKVDDYCINDARIVYDWIMGLAESCRTLGVEIGGTPGATARRFMNRLGEFSPVLWKTHKEFLRSYCGGRFEVCKRGVLFDVAKYDLVSAYPWALAQCPWLTKNARSNWVRRLNDDALYGSYKVNFEEDDYLGIAPMWKAGVRVYSGKENGCWLTLPEVRYLRDNGVNHEIVRGTEIVDENAGDMWKQTVDGLFKLKKKEGVGWGAKILLNSQYGVLIQLVRKSGKWVPIGEAKHPVDFAGLLELEEPEKAFEGGKYYSPAYAGHLTALVRLRLLAAAKDVGYEAYIGGHTDSVLASGKMRKGLGEGLGDWALEDFAPKAEVCKSGIYAMGDLVKIRGITRKGTADMLWDDTLQRKTRIGIKSAKNWDEVSLIVGKRVAHNYMIENKRDWIKNLTRLTIAKEEYIDSKPWIEVG